MIGDVVYEKDGYAIHKIDGEEHKVCRPALLVVLSQNHFKANIASLSSTHKTSRFSQSSSSTPNLSSSTSPRSSTISWCSSNLPLHSKAMALQHHHMAKLWDSTAKKR